MYRLNEETLDQVKASPLVQGYLAELLSRNTATVSRWIKENDIMLTTWDSLEFISKHLGKSKADCLAPIKEPQFEITNSVK